MKKDIETRITVLEAALHRLQFEFERDGARRRRARLIRWGLLAIVGTAYFVVMQEAMSGLTWPG